MSRSRYSIIPTDALHDERITDLHLRILCILGSHSDQNGWLIINQKTIAKVAGCHRETINRRLKDLVSWGFIRMRGRLGEDGRRLVNHYQVITDREPIEAETEGYVISGDHRGCDPLEVTGGVTSGDHRGCDRQRSQQGNDLYFERPLSDKSDRPATPKSALMRVLDEQHADAVIEHRKALRKKLTVHAATLLADRFEAFGDANAAADHMIANGWQSFETAWVRTEGPSKTVPGCNGFRAKRPRNVSEAAARRLAEIQSNGGGNAIDSE